MRRPHVSQEKFHSKINHYILFFFHRTDRPNGCLKPKLLHINQDEQAFENPFF